jgi:hypothetical protein
MALKRDLKGIFFMGSCYNLMQIATRIVEREQSMNASRDARRGSRTVLEVF